MKVLENTLAVLSLGKLCDENGYSCDWINGQKPRLIKNGIRIQCNTENFVSWLQACQRVRLEDLIRQLRGHFQDRRVIVQHLLQARLQHVQWVILRLENERIELKVTSLQWLCQLRLMKERRDPLYSEIPEWLQESKEKLVDDEIPEHGNSHASSSHEMS